MAKLTIYTFISDHLGGASQYDDVNLRAMLTLYVDRAVADLDYELKAAGTDFDTLDARGQGIYNRVASQLVWLQIKAQQVNGNGDVEDDAWDTALSDIGDALPVRTSLLRGTPTPEATGSDASAGVGGAAVDRAQVEAIVREAVASWALAGEPQPGGVGSQGPQGVQGPQGERGPQGPQGDQGEQGNPGPTGPQGEKGDKGDPGQDGTDGTDGTDGQPGARGQTGPAGPAQSNANIDARIAAFARTGATVNIPDARLPTILRGLPSAFGTAGQILHVNAGATALEFTDAPSGGGTGITVTQSTLSFGSDKSIAVTANTATAWTTLFTPTIPAGKHILIARLGINEANIAWCGTSYRLQRTRNSVEATVEDTPRWRANLRGNASQASVVIQNVIFQFESQAGDTFTFQVELIVDGVNNIGNAVDFPAASQDIKLTTFA